MADLNDQVSTLLYKADPKWTNFYRATKHLEVGERLAVVFIESNNLIAEEAGQWVLSNEQVVLLIKLYSTLDLSQKQTMTYLMMALL
jgi:hypothetical protein